MNQLWHQNDPPRPRTDSKKQRKQVLREMKRLTQVVRAHAQRYRALLDEQWGEKRTGPAPKPSRCCSAWTMS